MKKSAKHLVLEGDWGGQIYLTAPRKLVTADEAKVRELLQKLDEIAWSCNDGAGASMYDIPFRKNGVGGGMGGGMLLDGAVWLHGGFRSKPLFREEEAARLVRELLGLSPDVKIIIGDG